MMNSLDSPRFYCSIPLAAGAEIVLPDIVSHHAVRVLRLQTGAQITLFDGRGGFHTASIQNIVRDRVTVKIGAWCDSETESSLSITLAQAVQAADKMDYTLQKAVELGVTAIYPVTSRRSVVRLKETRAVKRVEHWRGVVASACEQSGRNRLPPVAEICDLDHWLAHLPIVESVLSTLPALPTLRLLLHPGAEQTLHTLPRPDAVELLVGAEGGLDPAEVDLARLRGFIPVRLGPRILRTETAGLAAIAAMQTLWGDFR